MNTDTQSAASWPNDLDPQTLDQIVAIIAKEGMVGKDAVVPGATLESLGFASIDVVSILMAVEEELGIYVPIDNELAATTNLSEFIAKIVAPGGVDGGSQEGA